jgi:Zn-dependent protease with chaperone function
MLDFLNFLVENKNVLLTFLLFIFFGFIIFVYLPYYFSATTNRLLYRVKLLKDFTEDELANSPKVKDIIRVVDNICSNYSLPRPDVGIYPSAILNAFTVGPKNRSLIAISSSLVNSMSLSEIRGVLGHEIAHIINHDNFRHHFFQGFLQLVSSFFISLIDRNLISPWLRKKKRRTKN